MVHQWVEKTGFTSLPEQQFASKSLTCVKNNLDMDGANFVKALALRKTIN